jgi:hypothetical protein
MQIGIAHHESRRRGEWDMLRELSRYIQIETRLLLNSRLTATTLTALNYKEKTIMYAVLFVLLFRLVALPILS